ncbi:transposase [Hymenobacter defluvii]|uniref:Transposase n=1 Tax=Hymenobacter defluvii TaxID=2054411 RepID=A0ABS3THZ3_9BACT|nr:transposase [Hymenobacter defluvii]
MGYYQTGLVLLACRWVIERCFRWAAHFRQLARDYKRLALSMYQFHFLAFVGLLLAKGVFLAYRFITVSSAIPISVKPSHYTSRSRSAYVAMNHYNASLTLENILNLRDNRLYLTKRFEFFCLMQRNVHWPPIGIWHFRFGSEPSDSGGAAAG